MEIRRFQSEDLCCLSIKAKESVNKLSKLNPLVSILFSRYNNSVDAE